MSQAQKPDEPFSLSRWSRRKREATRATEREAPAAAEPPPLAAATAPPLETAPLPPAEASVPLPPVESLTFDSDFTPFLQPKVDEATRRAALRKLFADPSFNVMDGLDVYIDDYSRSEPIPAEVVPLLAQARYLFSPPATRVTSEGYVEDVPEVPVAETPPDDAAQAAGEPGAADAAPTPAADAAATALERPSSDADPHAPLPQPR